MPTTEINSITTPESTSSPTVHEDLARLANQLVLNQIMRFANSAARTVAFTRLGVSPHHGAVSFLADVRRYEQYNGVAWVPMVSGLIARGQRTTNSAATTTTEIGVLRIDNIPILGGYAYTILTSALSLHSSVAGDRLRATVRADTTGAPATVGSTVLGLTQDQCDTTANPPTQPATCELYPTVDGTLSLWLGVQRQGGTGNVDILGGPTFPISLLVYFMGRDPGNSGVSL
ncbi:hypothetical protein [Catellatospora sp. NPDC049609]|uniref:hypothetical protein n=1 Tax=Catellatospora sp. NPDC049609 TaxID=3155505 RepID=UPI00342F5E08